MDVLAITSAGYGGKITFLDEGSLCYASGHGVVIHDKDSGQQRHVWTLPDGQGHPPPNMSPATFASCPGARLLAYVQQGGLQQQIRVVQTESLHASSTIKDPGCRHIEFTQLAFSADGKRLLSIGGPPDQQLDVWDLDAEESLLRLALPERLTGLEPAFFPLNADVLALAGPDAARLVWSEPTAGTRVVRQSEVELAVLADGERLTCMCWTPNGTLLLGTSASRLLGVKGAAPPAVPASGWGVQRIGGHVAELLYGPAEPRVPSPPPPEVPPPGPDLAPREAAQPGLVGGPAPPLTGVVAAVVTATHVLLVLAGDALTSAQLLWLSPQSLSTVGSAVLPLRMLVRAAASPSYEQLVLSAADGAVCLCSAASPAAAATGTLARHVSSNGRALGSGAGAPHGHGHNYSGSGSGGGASGPGSPVALASSAEPWSLGVGSGGDGGSPSTSHSRCGSRNGVSNLGAVHRATAVQVMEVARFHRGRVTGCIWLSRTRLVTGGLDGSVRMWSYLPHDSEPPEGLAVHPPALLLEAMWHASQAVTCMAAMHPPTPEGAEAAAAAAAAGGAGAAGAGGLSTGGGPAAVFGLVAPVTRPPAFLLGTAGGVVQLVNADRVPANAADAADLNQLAKSLASTWDVRLFNGPASAAAFSQDGQFCAVSCVSEGKVAFLRVMVLGHELSMRVLGFYPIREPRHLAWAPPEPGGLHPLLVVGSLLGEVVVLGLPEAGAMEDAADGLLNRGSLVKATLRAQSHITSLAVYPSPPGEVRGGGHFWVFTAHSDKSIRRYRMITDQQKAAAAVAARASAVAAAAAASGGGGDGGTGSYRTNSGMGIPRPKSSKASGLGRMMSIAPSGQNFQMPEAEKAMELQLSGVALSISLVPGGAAAGGGGSGSFGPPLRMAVAAADGSVAVYGMPEIALQGRWLLHEMASGGATAVCLMGDRLLTAGSEGSVQVLELASAVNRPRHNNPRTSNVGGKEPGTRSAFFGSGGPARPRGMERATLGSLLPVYTRTMLPSIHTGAEGAPTWQQARMQAIQHMHREQLTTFRTRAAAKCKEWSERIRELKQLNEAADEVERLSPEEFIIDTGLRRQMAAAGEARYAAVKQQLGRDLQVMELKRQKLREECLGSMEVVSRPLVPLHEYAFISPVDATEAKRLRGEPDGGAGGGAGGGGRIAADGGVWSYGLRKPSEAQTLRLRQVSFLRRVEQAECAARNAAERGAVVPIRRYRGDMLHRFHLVSEEEGGQGQGAQAAQGHGQEKGQGHGTASGAASSHATPGHTPSKAPATAGGQHGGGGAAAAPPAAAQLAPAGPSAAYDDEEDDESTPRAGGLPRAATRRIRDDGYEGAELGYGETGLLYADVHLYTHCRRAAQVVLIQEEVRRLRQLFNAKWAAARAAKQKGLDRIDERLARIVEIQKELTRLATEEATGEAPGPAPQHVPGCYYSWSGAEEMQALAEVREEEVKAAKYVPPEELARRAAAAAAEDAERRRAESDDARNRALKEMMNASPAVARQAKGGRNRLVREAWMDLPPGQLSKEQRIKLAEWERKRTELAEELEKQRRLLEAERRALEVDIADTAAGINADLSRLAHAKVRMDMEVVHLERRAVDIAATCGLLGAAEAVRGALGTQLGALSLRRARRGPLKEALEARVALAQRAFEDIALSEKQVDKAFRREYSSRPELWDDAQKVYRARSHLLQASPSSASSAGGGGGGGGQRGGSGGGGGPAGSRLPRKTAVELLGKSPEGLMLASALEAPPPVDPAILSRATSAAMPSRQPSLAHLSSRRNTPLDPAGGMGLAGPSGPDALVTSPRGVVRDMSQLARPAPLPGSPLHDFAQRHLASRPASPTEGGGRRSPGRRSPLPRSASMPPSLSPRHGLAAVLSQGQWQGAAGVGTGPADEAADAEAAPGGGAAAAGGEAGAPAAPPARRGVSQRPPGLRLRALVEKAGRPLEPLLQMVADGLPASSLSSELAPLGLHLPGNPLGNLDPYKVETAARVFSPAATGAAEALGGELNPEGEPDGAQSSRRRSSATGGRSTNTGSVSPARPEEPPPEEEEEDPLDSRERPEGMEDAMWIRLLEFRQTRADLERDAEDAWRRACLLTAQLDWFEGEEAEMEAAIDEAGARAAALRDGAAHMGLDVHLTYRLKNGQVELLDRPGDVVGSGDVLADAVILHRNRIEALNEEILTRGEGKIELLDTLRATRRRIHLTAWEAGAAELAGRHAAQRLSELQLLHVTKDLQAVIRDPTIVDRLSDEARLAVLWQSSANLHTHRLELRRRQVAALGARTSRSGAEAGELAVAEAAAEAAFVESSRVHSMMTAAKAAEDAGHRRHMRNIVSNAQLRTIAAQQAAELEGLAEALRTSHSRNFPALAPATAWAPPDYRPPPSATGSSRAATGGGAAAAADAAAALAPLRGASRGGMASRPASSGVPPPAAAAAVAALSPRPGSTRSPGLPRSPASAAGSPPPPPHPPSGPTVAGVLRSGSAGVTRSGGAGASLTRAYANNGGAAAGGGGGGLGDAPSPFAAAAGAAAGAVLSAKGGSPAGGATPRSASGLRPGTAVTRRS